jgi:hypothetical protein
MGIREFGNAFKQAVAEIAAGNNKIKHQIYPRQRRDKVAGSAEMLGQDYDYPIVQNDVEGSVMIDAFWDVLNGGNNARNDARSAAVRWNVPNTNMRAAGVLGAADRLFDLVVPVLNHGTVRQAAINLVNQVENWQADGLTDEEAG